MQQAAQQDRQRSNQSRCQLTKTTSQHEGRQVSFRDPNHDTEGKPIGIDGLQIPSQYASPGAENLPLLSSIHQKYSSPPGGPYAEPTPPRIVHGNFVIRKKSLEQRTFRGTAGDRQIQEHQCQQQPQNFPNTLAGR